MLIDLGGVTKAQTRQELEIFPLNKLGQYTPYYTAPEIM